RNAAYDVGGELFEFARTDRKGTVRREKRRTIGPQRTVGQGVRVQSVNHRTSIHGSSAGWCDLRLPAGALLTEGRAASDASPMNVDFSFASGPLVSHSRPPGPFGPARCRTPPSRPQRGT